MSGNSLVRIAVHATFATRGRRPWLRDDDLRHRRWACLAAGFASFDCDVIRGGGWEEHAHFGFYLHPDRKIAQVIKELERQSTLWVREQATDARGFYWQRNYAAFVISQSHVGQLHSYIARQEAHHRKVDPIDEWNSLVIKLGLDRKEHPAEPRDADL